MTIHGKRARVAGIPVNAAWYAYSYPLESLSADQFERLVVQQGLSEPWLFFLLLGGYCYFDARRELLRTNAFVTNATPTPHMLTLGGPFQPSKSAVLALRRASRVRQA